MSEAASIELRVVHDLPGEVEERQWEALRGEGGNAFLGWRFLSALESEGCVAPDRGWWPCHLTAWCDGDLVAAAPSYVKGDSAGDFSRDWGFAEAANRSGVRYYPKLVVGVPFTPVSGRRFLVRPDLDAETMTRLLLSLAEELARQADLSSIHVLYLAEGEKLAVERAGFVTRVLVQYHWHNRGYGCIEDWLGTLKSKKRTQIRRERRGPAEQGIAIHTVRGAEMAERAEHWSRLAYRLYRSTCEKYMWGGTYLNERFFRRYCELAPETAELVVARKGDEAVAGAFNVSGAPSHLFGRYWGCFEEHDFLHFNVCLYHSIEQCIERRIDVFEGGAGGEHKLHRGFDPTPVYTAHRFLDSGFHDGIGGYLIEQSRQQLAALERWTAG